MTDLHAQYQALIGRGMPEHPRLEADPCNGLVWWRFAGDDNTLIHSDDARDLVTMHALRWWLKAPRKGCPWSDTEFGPSDRAVILDAGEGQWWVGCSTNHLNGDWNEIRRSICILETIIASTEHLEPNAP